MLPETRGEGQAIDSISFFGDNDAEGEQDLSATDVGLPIALAVLKVAIVALVGYALARRGILHSSALTDISSLVIKVTVPCLIFANAAGGFTGASLSGSLLALGCGPVILGIGYISGITMETLLRVPPTHRRAVVAASTFHNSTYLPIAVATSVLPPLAAAFPPGAATMAAAIGANSLITVSLFGVLYSPLFWGLGLWWIAEGNASENGGRFVWLMRLLPPPVIGVLTGYSVGLTPIHLALTPAAAPLHLLFQAIRDIGSLTIPLANLILGGMLAQALAKRATQKRDAICTIAAKLIVTPAITLALLAACHPWWAHDAPLALAAFVILLQAASPPATNLAVMTKGFANTEGSQTPLVIPGLLLAAYPMAVVTMPLWLLAFFRLMARHD